MKHVLKTVIYDFYIFMTMKLLLILLLLLHDANMYFQVAHKHKVYASFQLHLNSPKILE